MAGLLGAAVFWLAGYYLVGGDAVAPPRVAWMLMTLLALCCGLLHWHGRHDGWLDRIVHFLGLLALAAAYAVYWDGLRTAVDDTAAGRAWPLTAWLIFGVALPLGLGLLAPARGLLESRAGYAEEDYYDDD